MASRASGSDPPASSNMTRPGLTTATQCSGEPLPEPMRVSAGFCVTGFSREKFFPTLPPRLFFARIPALAAALDLAGHRDPGRLDLAVGQPAGVERLQAVVAERDHGLALRGAGAAA